MKIDRTTPAELTAALKANARARLHAAQDTLHRARAEWMADVARVEDAVASYTPEGAEALVRVEASLHRLSKAYQALWFAELAARNADRL